MVQIQDIPILNGGRARLSTQRAGEMLGFLLSIPNKEMTALIRNQIIGTSPLANNLLNLFSIVDGINGDKYNMVKFHKARHLWSSRNNACQFTPKGKVTTSSTSFDLYPIEYNGKECPAEFFGSDWETLFGTYDPINMLKTREGALALNAIIQVIIDSLHDDFWNLAVLGGSPHITTAETNSTYTVGEAEWNDFKDQMSSNVGFITSCDLIKAQGLDNFNVEIKDADISGKDYIGDVASDLFVRMREAGTREFKTASKTMRYGRPIMLVSDSIFYKYKDELIAKGNGLIEGYKLFTQGNDGMRVEIPYALMWDGHIVVNFNEIEDTDAILGTATHIALNVIPGVFPMLIGLNNGGQMGRSMAQNDWGLRVQQSERLEDKGAVFMYTAFKFGTGVLNTDLVTYATKRVAV